MYGLDEPKGLEALPGETTANKAELVDTLVLLDCLRAMASWDGDEGVACLNGTLKDGERFTSSFLFNVMEHENNIYTFILFIGYSNSFES